MSRRLAAHRARITRLEDEYMREFSARRDGWLAAWRALDNAAIERNEQADARRWLALTLRRVLARRG